MIKLETYTVSFENLSPIKICFIGDFHLGVNGCAEDDLRATINAIKNTPNTYWIGMGDYADYREPENDKYDYEVSKYTIEEQLDILFSLFDSISEKGLGMLIGNHEYRVIRRTTDNPIKRWCKDNDVIYLSHMAHLRILFSNDDNYSFIVSHGVGGGKKYGSKVNALTEFISEHDVDAVVMGHNHSLAEWAKVELEYPNGEPKARYKVCGFSGTFYKTYQKGTSGYQERKLYPPTPIGFLCADIDPNPNRLNNGFNLPCASRGLQFHTIMI